ncbi:T-cell surface glycoprotein CD1e, membrane-associated-like isoform X5 [Saccopteryx leptura]|uniref:T-cell surface glycoprotein CD1e, membrane-associated-like isoform X5 n=1 Tax=Saccopteryx leptura TaxID=249018 RepID=UPI00339BE10F
MLLLLPLLFKGILCHGPSTVATQVLAPHHPATEEPSSFRLLQISSFANQTWQHTEGSGWLGELQTQRWDPVSSTIQFLWPWAGGNFSKEEMKNIQALLQLYMHSFPREVQAFSSQFQLKLKPQAWVTKGSSPGPGRLLLVCHVSGFHPKPVWVMWMRGQQEQQGTRQGEVLPHADGTWYLRVTLDVAAGQASGLYCRVKHSSLGGRDIIIHWDGYPIFLILFCLAVAVTLITVLVVGSWIKQHSSNQSLCSPHAPSPAAPMDGNTQEPRSSGNHLCLAQRSWIKNKFLKKWKKSLYQL